MTRSTSTSLRERLALVTGANRGIGRAIALRLGESGVLVAVHYAGARDGREIEAADTVADIEKAGGHAFAVPFDFLERDPSDLIGIVVDQARAEQGAEGLDILVNNAAYSNPTPFAEVSADMFDRHVAVNLRAPFLLIQAAARVMPAGSSIVNISSSTTRVIAPDQAPYSISKGGLNTLSWYLAKELARQGINLNAVVAGVTRTELSLKILGEEGLDAMADASPFGRVGEGRDIADVVAFLVSREARWVTGQAIDVTGGQTLT